MIAMFTDVHFFMQNFDKEFFHYQLDFFEKQFFPYLLENNIKEVICLGDLAHHRQLVDIYIQQTIEERFIGFFEKHNIKLYIIAGNHDVYWKNSNEISYVYLLKKYECIEVIDKPKVITIDGKEIGFVPWGMEDNMPKPEHCELLCGHFEIGGVPYNKHTLSRGGLKLSKFNDYRMVLSGHYHIYSENGNVIYLGTVQQLDRNDYGVRKGFYTYDNKRLELVENKVSPKFIKVEYREDKEGLNIVVDDGLDKKEFTNIGEAEEFIGDDWADVFIHKYKKEALLDKFVDSLKNQKRTQNYEVLDEITKEVAIEEDNKGNLEISLWYISQLEYEEDIVVKRLQDRFSQLYVKAEADCRN